MSFASCDELAIEIRRLDTPEVSAGAANWILVDIADDPVTFDDANAFVDLWLTTEHLPVEQMGWILANGFGDDWPAPLLKRLAEANEAGNTAMATRVLDLLRIAGLQAGRPPVILGSYGDGTPPLAAPIDLPRPGAAPGDPPDGVAPSPPPPAPSPPAPPAPPFPTESLPGRGERGWPRIPWPRRRKSAPEPEPEPRSSAPFPGSARFPSGNGSTSAGDDPAGSSDGDDRADWGDDEEPAHITDGDLDPRRFQVSRDRVEAHVVQFEFSERRALDVLPITGDPSLPAEVIPAGGLATRWVVSSAQPISAVDDQVGVTVFSGRKTEHWLAEFELSIPKVGDSEIRRLRCDGDDRHVLDVRVYTTGFDATLLRHLVVSVSTADAAEPDIDDDAVSEVSDSIGVQHHEFTSPPDDLVLMVDDDFASVKHGPGPPESELWPTAAELKGPIDGLRHAADAFRSAHSAQLDAVDAAELAARLKHDFVTGYLFRTRDWQFDTYDDIAVSAEHQAAWDAVASSDEALDLAFDGYTLYNTFFPEGSKIRQVLDAMPAGSRINVDWPIEAGNASVPWSLMYTDLPPCAGPIDATRFFGLRFRLSWSKWRRAPTSQVLGKVDRAERLHLLYWEHDDIGTEADHQREQASGFGTIHRVVPDLATVATAPARQQAIAELTAPTGAAILHFYCHCIQDPVAKETKLVFGPIQRQADFKVSGRDFGAGRFLGGPLVFVNACDSAGADAYEVNQLEQMFFSRGCRAFMGTEIKVPVVLAARFAHIFFALIEEPLDGSRLFAGEAAAHARRYLWLNYRNIGGLFYSYIHHYGLRMEP